MRLLLALLQLSLLALSSQAIAQPTAFNLAAQKNLSAKDFIQDLATQAGLTVIFIEKGRGNAPVGIPAPTSTTVPGDGENAVYSGNNIINTTSNTPGLAGLGQEAKRGEVPLPAQFNVSFNNLQGVDAYAQLREILDLMGFRAFRSRAANNVIYVSDKLSAPAQVAMRLRVLLINDNLANERGISFGTGLTSGAYDAAGNPVAFGRFGLDFANGGALQGSGYPGYSGLVAGGGQETNTGVNFGNRGVVSNRSTFTFGIGNIVLQLQTLERINALQTLLDQQLVVNDGETATISQNIQFRIPQAVISNGAVLGTTQAVNARTTLNLTPVILPSKKQVQVSVRGDFSDPQGSGSDLVINTNSVDVPNLRLDSGGVALLGGVTRRDESEVEYRVPVLGAIPLLGELFSSRSRLVRNQRLVILIEPVIQDQPLAGAELSPATPAVRSTPRNLPGDLNNLGRRLNTDVQAPTPITPLE